MIPEIKNTFLRRLALVWTVAAIIICLGPIYLVLAVLEWVEDEFEINMVANWRAAPKKETK